MCCFLKKLLLDSFHIFAGTSVYPDLLALVNEHGNLNFNARFKLGFLGCVGCGVAGNSGFGFGYEKLDEVFTVDGECLTFVELNGNGIVLLNPKRLRPDRT